MTIGQHIRPTCRHMRRSLGCLAIFGLLPAAAPDSASALLRGCDAKDARCLGETYSAPCMAKATPWPETCEALLEELLSYPTRDSEPEILATAAFAHYLLADAAESDADAATRKQSALELYLRVLTLDPNHSDAFTGLAILSEDDIPQRIRWLREALRVRGPISLTSGALASALDELGTREAQREAAAVMRSAYDAQPWGRHKWHLASQVLWRYRRLGEEAEAEKFANHARADIGIARLLDTLRTAEDDSEAAVEALKNICYHEVLAIVGASACIDGVELGFAAALSARDVVASDRLVQEGLEHMWSIPITSSGRVDRPAEIAGWLEQLEAAGHASFELYFALGRCYIDLRRSEEALAALARAYGLASGYQRDSVNRHVAIARNSDWLASGGHPVCVPQDSIVVE